jgi:ribonuclease BN (tRNA processing enzyme)
VRLRVLGSNGAYPTPGHPASGYLIDEGNTLVWIDAGPGTFVALQEVASPYEVDAVVITHVHGDHCGDLFPLFNLLRLGPAPRRGVPVFVPEGAAAHLGAFARAGPDHDFYSVFDFHTVARSDDVHLGPVRVRFGEAAHPVPTLAVRVEGGGRSLTYSGDTGPGGDLEELARGGTVLLCEATYQGDPRRDPYPFHLSAAEAGRLAAAAGVERLIVTHLAPTLDPAVSVAEAEAAFGGPVEWAAPGLEVAI